MSLEKKLEDYKNSNCQDCTLAGKRTLIAPYRGNPKAKIIGIGEAPGKFEDIAGETFVGPAGQLIDKYVDYVGLSVNEHFLLINTVMCRPKSEDYDTKENRQPLVEELAACQPKLKDVVNSAQPKLIVLFGVPALRNCLPDGPKRIGAAVGKFYPPEMHIFDCDADVYAMYHPSYILRYKQYRQYFATDMIRLKHYAIGIGAIE